MAKAILTFPEAALPDVIRVLKAGLHYVEWEIDYDNKAALEHWIREQEGYLSGTG
jgi:hypothetical protein